MIIREAAHVEEIKRVAKAKVSYQFIRKRLERLGHISPGQFAGVQFKNLEDLWSALLSAVGFPLRAQRW